VTAVALLAAAALACSDDEPTPEASDGTAADTGEGAPRLPEEIEPGCGDQAVTDPTDLGAGRVLARCGAGAPEARPLPAPTPVRVAVPSAPGPEVAPVFVAEALGEFADEGLEVTTVPLDDRAAYEALEAGEVDVVVGPVGGAYLDALDGGSGARLVIGGTLTRAPNDPTRGQTGLWVRDDAAYDLEDLELQPVGVPGGVRSAATYPLDLAFNQTEATLNELAVVDVGGPEAARALVDGELAAAWLDGAGWPRVAAESEGMHLAATLPASESIDGTVVSARLLGPDRPVGLAYARAVVRTINTHLTGDYADDEDVMAAVAEGTELDAGTLEVAGPQLFDWELRDGTVARTQEALVIIGGVGYDERLPASSLLDRSLVAEAIGASTAP
jgi:NitT/TauT family transport system substrate-binding protein